MTQESSRVILATALAIVLITLCEKVFGLHLNGTSPMITGSFTVIVYWLLGKLDEPDEEFPDSFGNKGAE